MVRSGGASTFPIVNWLAMPCGRLGRWAFLTLLTLAVVVLLIHERFTLKNDREKKNDLVYPSANQATIWFHATAFVQQTI